VKKRKGKRGLAFVRGWVLFLICGGRIGGRKRKKRRGSRQSVLFSLKILARGGRKEKIGRQGVKKKKKKRKKIP